jgi:flagellin
MSVINTNVNAVLAQNSLVKNERAMSSAMEQLSTGKRINSAADDAAGMAIASKMTAQIRGLDQAGRNINDAVSMIQTAEGATNEITNMLQRMRELSVQANSGTYTAADKANIELEFQALLAGIDNIADNTQWNGMSILNKALGADTVFQVGANSTQTLTVNLGNLKSDAYVSGSTVGFGVSLSAATSTSVSILTTLDTALAAVSTQNAKNGAAINRLEYTADSLANVSLNTQASRSRIEDADYAKATTELARTQIIQQAGTAMLAQANQQSQGVLALLQ